MKNTQYIFVGVLCAVASASGFAQNISTHTHEFEVDFSDSKKLVTSTVPVINRITPVADI